VAGETTSASAAERKAGGYTVYGGPGETMTKAYATGQLELNDVMEFGYIPAGVKLLGFIYKPDDLDSSTGLVQKITVGSTDVATGLTGGQTGAGSFVAITPYTTTAPTLVKLTCTTAATGAQAGNVYLTPVYSAY
jgi:hypothetical protein